MLLNVSSSSRSNVLSGMSVRNAGNVGNFVGGDEGHGRIGIVAGPETTFTVSSVSVVFGGRDGGRQLGRP